ncbi:MAG: group II intron reverse transcriptase/maturase [Candidatus Cloacimonadales bacterium]|nr:group II intron reverse transcriptase/maturase [Candidatus Cloacimonadales bacterium]
MIDENLKDKPGKALSGTGKVRSFQRKIYLKAKQEKEFCFYVMHDKISLQHFLFEAWKRVKANQGVPGYDKVTFLEIEEYGVESYLRELAEELKAETYKPQPILRVYVPKANGKMRPLGIPTIRDRIVQMSCKMVIEPVFEADFEDCSYGFRPKRSAKGAITEIKSNLKRGNTNVYDADLSGFFDNIPHDKLLILLEKRISDKRVINLIKKWLKCTVFEDNKLHKSRKGVPQGGVISPLLANIYLNLLDKAVARKDGYFYKYGISMIRYADDFILMGRKLPEASLEYLNKMLEKMELDVNTDKTKQIDARKESFDFLGFTFRYDRGIYGNNGKYWNVVPSKKSELKIREKIRKVFRYCRHFSSEAITRTLNPIIRGWLNYFSIRGISYPSTAKGKLHWYLDESFYRFFQRKSQRKCKLYRRSAFAYLVSHYGLIDPARYTFV